MLMMRPAELRELGAEIQATGHLRITEKECAYPCESGNSKSIARSVYPGQDGGEDLRVEFSQPSAQAKEALEILQFACARAVDPPRRLAWGGAMAVFYVSRDWFRAVQVVGPCSSTLNIRAERIAGDLRCLHILGQMSVESLLLTCL